MRASPEVFSAPGEFGKDANNFGLMALISFFVLFSSFDLRAYRWTQVMIFAIDEINKNASILPNILLGYTILSSCASPTTTLRAALTGASQLQHKDSTSPCPPAISALIAESGSTQSLVVAELLGTFHVPIVRRLIKHLKHCSSLIVEFFTYLDILFCR